jgi:integrase
MFAQIVQASRDDEVHHVRESTLTTYHSYMKTYERLLLSIQGAPEPYPITEEKVRAAIKVGRDRSSFGRIYRKKPLAVKYVELLITAIRCYQAANLEPDIISTPQFRNFIQSLRLQDRALGTNAAVPITPLILAHSANYCDGTLVQGQPDFSEIMLMTMASVMFYGFLRFSEAANLYREDIHVDSEGNITITIRASKTDPLGRGAVCFLKSTETAYRPFKWLSVFTTMGGMDSENPFLIANRTFNFRFKKLLTKVHGLFGGGWNPQDYSSHSMRRGGATAAAQAGVQDAVIQRHGRWKSTVFMRYTELERKEAGEIITGLI